MYYVVLGNRAVIAHETCHKSKGFTGFFTEQDYSSLRHDIVERQDYYNNNDHYISDNDTIGIKG